MQVAFFDLEAWQADYLQAKLAQIGLAERVQGYYSTEHLTLENCAPYASCEGIAVFVWTKVTRERIASLPALCLVLTTSTGYDYIDWTLVGNGASWCAMHPITVITLLQSTPLL